MLILILFKSIVIGVPDLLMVISALVVVLILPGHVFFSILLPDLLSNDSDLLNSPGIWVIPVTSVSIVSLIGFLLSIFGQLNELLITLIFSTLLVIAIFSKSVEINFDLPPKIVKRSITDFPKGITDSPFSSIFLVSILLGSLTVFFEIDDNEIPWVEFYITSEDGNVDTIPRNWSSPEPIELVLEIVNHGVTEELTVSKTVELLNSDIISRENLTVSQSDFQDGRVTIIDSLNFSHQGEYKVQYNLTKSGEKTTFRSLQLLINYTG